MCPVTTLAAGAKQFFGKQCFLYNCFGVASFSPLKNPTSLSVFCHRRVAAISRQSKAQDLPCFCKCYADMFTFDNERQA